MGMRIFALTAIMIFTFGNTRAQDSSGAAKALAQPYAQFGFDVLRDLSSQHSSDSIFVSPCSIAVALAMLSNGASGTTRQAILKTLHSDGQSMDALNTANQALVEQINKTTAVQLAVANGLWLEKSAAVNPQFTQILKAAYGADAENVDFRDPKSADIINSWIEKHTNGRIQKILDRTDPSTVAILGNAIAFKGKWSLPFEPKLTRPHDFKTASRGVRKIPMMEHSAEYSYAQGDSLESIRLPYADGSFAMYVVLPEDANAMRSFVQRMTAERFSALISSLRRRQGTIDLPRFTMTYRTTLNATLSKLGMGIAFDAGADFSDIHQPPPRMQISEVRHASFLKVDEEGTEAAAATTTAVLALARPTTPPFCMVVDHPFFIAIRDERSGQILFMGVVAEPQD